MNCEEYVAGVLQELVDHESNLSEATQALVDEITEAFEEGAESTRENVTMRIMRTIGQHKREYGEPPRCVYVSEAEWERLPAELESKAVQATYRPTLDEDGCTVDGVPVRVLE